MGWEELEVVDPDADAAKKGEEAAASTQFDQVSREVVTAALKQHLNALVSAAHTIRWPTLLRHAVTH